MSYQSSFPGHSLEIAGSTSGESVNTGSQARDSGYVYPVSHPACSFSMNAGSSSTSTMSIPDGTAGIKYPNPDVSSMIFDPATGYWFDQITGLYYVAESGLFINKLMNTLLRWNPDIHSYTVVGRASDVAAPAQARFVEHELDSVNKSVPQLPPVSAHVPSNVIPAVPSSSGDMRPFRRERSLSFEEMSPVSDESHPDRYSPSKEQSPHRDNLWNQRERRRSLSFDEMTPERDLDDNAFSFDNRSPSEKRSRHSSRSPRSYESPKRKSVFPVSTYDRDSPDRYSRGRRSPGQAFSRSPERDDSRRRGDFRSSRRDDSRSPRRGVSRSPRRDDSRSPRRDDSRSPRRDDSRSPRRDFYRDRNSRLSYRPRPDSLSSRSSVRSRSRQRSPQYNRGYNPEKAAPKMNFSPDREANRRLSPARSGRFQRSPSPSFARRLENENSDRGQASSNRGRRCRSRSRPRTIAKGRSNQRVKSRSPLGGKRTARDDPDLAESYVSDVSKPLVEFTHDFMKQNIRRIHHNILRNPANIFGRMFPFRRYATVDIMLSPLPDKGKREWADLEILLEKVLKADSAKFDYLNLYTGDGGAPCNLCMIRFTCPEEAFRWYLTHEGTIDLTGPDGSSCTVFMNFTQNNWKCPSCGTSNCALRHFCYKCFIYLGKTAISTVQVKDSVTLYVGISGLDCRFMTLQEVFLGFPPLGSVNVESFEVLTEICGIPLGLCVFKFKELQESAEFHLFLRENSMNPIFVDIVDRTGLALNSKPGHHLKDIASLKDVPSKMREAAVIHSLKCKMQEGGIEIIRDTSSLKFDNLPETDPMNNPSLWWQFGESGVAKEGDNFRYLFRDHPLVGVPYDSVPPVVLIGPLPIPPNCDLMNFRNLLSQYLQRTGVHNSTTDRIAICKAQHFGAPYDFSLLRFNNKPLSKEWLERHQGKVVFSMKDGSDWPVSLYYSKPNWQCESCHKLNFPIRIQCFFCYKARMSDHTPVTFRNNPTNSIGIVGYQNWCATEELLYRKLPFLSDIKNITISYLKEPTGVPLGICLLKSHSPAASEMLFKKLQDALASEIAMINSQIPKRSLLVYIV